MESVSNNPIGRRKMADYMYPTRTNFGDEWLKEMLMSWKNKCLRYLCFPWIKFRVHTITDNSFWLYMYYSLTRSDIPDLMGVIEYRLKIIDWGESQYQVHDGHDVFLARKDEPGTAWFLVDQYEEIQKAGGGELYLSDFSHAKQKRLGSALRNSIPPVTCQAKIVVRERYSQQGLTK